MELSRVSLPARSALTTGRADAQRQALPWVHKFAILVCCLAPFLFVAGFWYFVCDWMPDSITERLQGMTRAEVRQLLGEPTSFSGTDQYGNGTVDKSDRWIYIHPIHMVEFRVDFDSDGRVERWSYDR